MISKLKLAAYAGAFALAFFIGYQYSQNQSDKVIAELNLEHSEYLRLVAEANAQVILKQSKEIESLIGKNNELDAKYTKEMNDVKEYSNKLVNELSTAKQRLRVRVTPSCPTDSGKGSDSAATSSVDGERAYADIHPAVAAGIFRVSGKADQCQVKLNGLQQYVYNLLDTYGAEKKNEK